MAFEHRERIAGLTESSVHIPVAGAARLDADLVKPAHAGSIVAFAHGTGSSRHSPRNRAVARVLQQAGLGTLLLDLLTEREERVDEATAEYRFDLQLLGRRIIAAIDWLNEHPQTAGLPLGLFGASTGAAAALIAAAERPDRVTAVVSRGGRPDLAAEHLSRVRAPVLLIVGGRDPQVLQLNRQAAEQLSAPHHLEIIPGATHLFAENHALEQVALKARDWFLAPGQSNSPDQGGSRTLP
ncbi:MAG TPA: alpha/beta family hydrolase [Actinocrinis sp.]|uniref:dienelactone hydrolase family protein n=1 Tax=Actinocrinis sp. TaxID=1920516 RepID=UPI002D2EF5E8|nr:alpha/beta family hydrolase [Actinocrinis sp.]HZU57015.1 alpha/beta family hydrolase [Actinocrinis sp.]